MIVKPGVVQTGGKNIFLNELLNLEHTKFCFTILWSAILS